MSHKDGQVLLALERWGQGDRIKDIYQAEEQKGAVQTLDHEVHCASRPPQAYEVNVILPVGRNTKHCFI